MVYELYKKVIDLLMIRYFCAYYYFYNFFNEKLRNKMDTILQLDENDINLLFNEQEEQALPGMHKYQQNGWYKYMFGRYLFSLKFIKDKHVLDTACGFGWGSYLIADYPKHLISIDIDEKSLNFAKTNWKFNQIDFRKMSVLELSKLETKIDVVLSYEVIEHLKYTDGEIYIEEVSKILNSKGVFILSSYFPDYEEDARIAEEKNEYHPHIYTKKEMELLLLNNNFCDVKYYGDLIIKAEIR